MDYTILLTGDNGEVLLEAHKEKRAITKKDKEEFKAAVEKLGYKVEKGLSS